LGELDRSRPGAGRRCLPISALSVGFLAGLGPWRPLGVTPSTEPLSLLPLPLVPTVAVPLAIALHLVSLHRLHVTARPEERQRRTDLRRRWLKHALRPTQPSRRSRSGWAPAGAGAGMDPGGAQPGQPVRILGQALDDPPDGRVEATGPNSSGWSRKAARSLKQSPPSASITAKVPQHGRVRMTAPATDLLPAKHAGQPEPVGQLTQQRRPRMADHTDGVSGDFEAGRELVACTRKVPSLTTDTTFAQPYPPWSGGHFHNQTPITSKPTKSPG
jgi:hypothetical protein